MRIDANIMAMATYNVDFWRFGMWTYQQYFADRSQGTADGCRSADSPAVCSCWYQHFEFGGISFSETVEAMKRRIQISDRGVVPTITLAARHTGLYMKEAFSATTKLNHKKEKQILAAYEKDAVNSPTQTNSLGKGVIETV
ncbi:hypothetical protein ScPMuIL_008426 [Solemya velum]